MDIVLWDTLDYGVLYKGLLGCGNWLHTPVSLPI